MGVATVYAIATAALAGTVIGTVSRQPGAAAGGVAGAAGSRLDGGQPGPGAALADAVYGAAGR